MHNDKSMKQYTLAEISEKLGAKLVLDPKSDSASGLDETTKIHSLATLVNAKEGQVAFLANSKYSSQLAQTKASAVIIDESVLSECTTHALVMENPYMGYAMLANLLDTTPKSALGVHASAVVAEGVKLGSNVSIGANAVIESGVSLGDDVEIGANCFIGKNVTIGSSSKLWSNISIYHEVSIGINCLIQANTVIGSDGFGYAPTEKEVKWMKIPQLGSVVLGNNVEIGASTTIDRGALDDTIIENGVILDNQVHIAHNSVIGSNTAIAGCSVVAGSTTIGKNCTIAGLVGINGHISIADNCFFTGMAMVTKNITESGVYSSGMPAVSNKEWRKTNARIKRLDSITSRIKVLESLITK
jgi:UDP-3-O-[3-hydroxymyristoyl] glucosamine N-acyltransferase